MKEMTEELAVERLKAARAANNPRKIRHWALMVDQCKARDLKRKEKEKKKKKEASN